MKIATTVIAYLIMILILLYYFYKKKSEKKLSSKGIVEVHYIRESALGLWSICFLCLTLFTLDIYLHFFNDQTTLDYLHISIVFVVFALIGIFYLNYSITFCDDILKYNNGFFTRSYNVNEIKKIVDYTTCYKIVVKHTRIRVWTQQHENMRTFRILLESYFPSDDQ